MRLASAPLAAAIALVASACAPISSFRPASGLADGRSGEVGLGGSLVSPRPYVAEPVQAAGQMWLTKHAAKGLGLSAIGAVEASAFAVGGAARMDLLRSRRFVVAPEVELGLAWGAINGGVALRLFHETWLYSAPRFGSRGSTWAFDAPVGLSAYLYDGFSLRVELRAMWIGDVSYYQQRRVLGIAIARQF